MSVGRGYTITIKLKGDALEKLERMEREGLRMHTQFSKFAGIPAGQFAGLSNDLLKESKTHTSLWQKIQGLNQGALLKLVGISGGIGLLVGAMVKASPLLGGVFKLFETTFLIFLRPFANFLGFALLPLSIQLLRASIAFNTTVGPWFKKYGEGFGRFLVGTPASPEQAAKVAEKQQEGGIEAINEGNDWLSKIWNSVNLMTQLLGGQAIPGAEAFEAPLTGTAATRSRNIKRFGVAGRTQQPGHMSLADIERAQSSGPGLFGRAPAQEIFREQLEGGIERRTRGSRGGAAPMSFTMNVQNFSGAFAELKTAQNQIGGWITNKLKELGVV